MKVSSRRLAAASISVAVLAGNALATDASTIGRATGFLIGGAPFVRFAAPNIYGGGATLPIPGYLGQSLKSGTFGTGLAGSIFGFFATQPNGANVQYCATGSGKGKGVFIARAPQVQQPCANAATGMTGPIGFSAPAGVNFPALTGTDAPLAQSEYGGVAGSFITDNGATQLEPVELPSLIGSIALY